jgi:hypothetical protein
VANKDGNGFSQSGRNSRLSGSSGGVTAIQFVTHKAGVQKSILNVSGNGICHITALETAPLINMVLDGVSPTYGHFKPWFETKLITANKPVLTPVVLVVLMLCRHLVVESCNTLLVNSRRSAQRSLDVATPTS